jgi:hypothetical protein
MPSAHVIIEDESLRHGFTQIPNLVLRDPTISPGAKVVFGLLLSYAWQRDDCYPGQDLLAADMGAGERSVRRYLQELEQANLVTVKQRGLGLTNVYVIHRLRPAILADQERPETTP